jgi:hypothetical protein
VKSKAAVVPAAGKNLDDRSTLIRYAFRTWKKARNVVEHRDETSSQTIPGLGCRRALDLITHRDG